MNDWEAFWMASYDPDHMINGRQKLLAKSGPFPFVPSIPSLDLGSGTGTSYDWKIHACSRICFST